MSKLPSKSHEYANACATSEELHYKEGEPAMVGLTNYMECRKE